VFMQRLYLCGYSNSLKSFNSQTALWWRFNVTGNNKMYVGVHVKYPNLTKFGISEQIFIDVAQYQISRKSVQ
jgi:hypothetical protein